MRETDQDRNNRLGKISHRYKEECGKKLRRNCGRQKQMERDCPHKVETSKE
jgi:hypothetical protein